MSKRFVITDNAGKIVVPSGKFGYFTDMYLTAGGTATAIALYSGTTTGGNLMCIHKAAANTSNPVTNMRLEFSDAGVYALVDANTEALVLVGSWGGPKAAAVLSGG